jgi:hypothetical protein
MPSAAFTVIGFGGCHPVAFIVLKNYFGKIVIKITFK